MKHKSKSEKLNFLGSLLFLAVIAIMIAGITAAMLPLLKQVAAAAKHEEELVETLREYGNYQMPIIFVLLQALQIITIIFPCAAVQVLAGLCSGIMFGTLYCVLGYLLGNWIVFFMVRRFRGLFSKAVEKQNKMFGFLKDSKHPETIAFLLFLIPGIPNGILPYIFAQTNVSLKKYLTAITYASIPSIVICSVTGQLVASGEYIAAGIISLIIVAIFMLVLAFRKKIMEKIASISQKP